MRVFVVGATGILGRHLLPLLLSQGHSVRTIARSPEKVEALRQDGIEVQQGDLLDADTAARLPAMLTGCEAAIHIATAIPSNPTEPGAWRQTSSLRMKGTQHLLQAALKAGVPSYIQQSIIMAYVNGDDRWLDESTPFDTSLDRALIVGPVRIMENLLRATPSEKLRWCILRGGNFVGHGTRQDHLVAALRAGKASVPCDGSYYQSFVHVADMAAAILAALQRAPASSTFNIAAEPVQYGAYLDQLASLLQVPPPPRQLDQPCPPSYRASSAAAREVLGWESLHSIYEDVG